MKVKGPAKRVVGKQPEVKKRIATNLKQGDTVMVIAGGNKRSGKILKGQVGKLLRILPKSERVVVEGVNMIKRHKRAMTSTDTAGIITKEGSVHISNVMYYSADLKRPVRLKSKVLDDGRKVRGFVDPKTKKFQQLTSEV